jgi:hypothetical protein
MESVEIPFVDADRTVAGQTFESARFFCGRGFPMNWNSHCAGQKTQAAPFHSVTHWYV